MIETIDHDPDVAVVARTRLCLRSGPATGV
jgi:hypothetical protein